MNSFKGQRLFLVPFLLVLCWWVQTYQSALRTACGRSTSRSSTRCLLDVFKAPIRSKNELIWILIRISKLIVAEPFFVASWSDLLLLPLGQTFFFAKSSPLPDLLLERWNGWTLSSGHHARRHNGGVAKWFQQNRFRYLRTSYDHTAAHDRLCSSGKVLGDSQ